MSSSSTSSHRGEDSHYYYYDCVITLGGGSQRGPSPSTLPIWVLRRLELASFLFSSSSSSSSSRSKKNQEAEKKEEEKEGEEETQSINNNSKKKKRKLICLSAGTPHRPNFVDEKSGFPILESVSQAEYLRTVHQTSTESLSIEKISTDTIGNCYFLKSSFLDPVATSRRFKRVAVVTSDFHMARTRDIFDWMLLLKKKEKEQEKKNEEEENDEEELLLKVPKFFENSSSSSSEISSLFPFEAKFVGRSVPEEFLSNRKQNQQQQQQQTHHPHPHHHDFVDYYSVSDENSMSSEVLQERIEKEKGAHEGFLNGIVKRLESLRCCSSTSLFWEAVSDFVLDEHKCYCAHENMLKFPPKEQWMKTAHTY